MEKPDINAQMQSLLRGAERVYTAEELESRLKEFQSTGRQMRVKFGMDPTAPDIHLGHSVVLRKLRQFQDLGHKAVLIIGDYTARIGDPTGQNTTRPILSTEQIQANAKTYFEQAGKILDNTPKKLEVCYNSDFLAKLTFADVLRLAGQMTVARMLERDTFALRYKDGVPIGLHEFLYPLMQAYDSVCMQADVELGGSDQTFNCLCGRDIQRNSDQRPQVVMVMPILVGLDGTQKMSKSKGNYVAITDAPSDMFGKIMSIPDALMSNYFTLLTDMSESKIRDMVDPAKTHPRKAKAQLGRMIVTQYYDAQAGQAASDEFDRVFAAKENPTDMPEVPVSCDKMGIRELLTSSGFAASGGEARRLIEQNAVTIDGEKVNKIDAVVELRSGQVLRVGKRRFGKIVVKG